MAQDWFPTEPAASGGTATSAGLNDSDYWGRTSDEPDAPGRGFLGDVPCASWSRRVGSCAVDATLTWALAYSWQVIFGSAKFFVLGFLVAVLMNSILGVGTFWNAKKEINPDQGFWDIGDEVLGRSIGQSLFGLQVVRPIRSRNGQLLVRPGGLRTLSRALLHCFDMVLLPIGWLTPGFDRFHRTVADQLTHVVVVYVGHNKAQRLPEAPADAVNLT